MARLPRGQVGVAGGVGNVPPVLGDDRPGVVVEGEGDLDPLHRRRTDGVLHTPTQVTLAVR